MAIFAWIDLVTGIALATAELTAERADSTRVCDDTWQIGKLEKVGSHQHATDCEHKEPHTNKEIYMSTS